MEQPVCQDNGHGARKNATCALAFKLCFVCLLCIVFVCFVIYSCTASFSRMTVCKVQNRAGHDQWKASRRSWPRMLCGDKFILENLALLSSSALPHSASASWEISWLSSCPLEVHLRLAAFACWAWLLKFYLRWDRSWKT